MKSCQKTKKKFQNYLNLIALLIKTINDFYIKLHNIKYLYKES